MRLGGWRGILNTMFNLGKTLEAQGLCVDSPLHGLGVFFLSFLLTEGESTGKPGGVESMQCTSPVLH